MILSKFHTRFNIFYAVFFIIKGFRIIVFIFIVISVTIRPICHRPSTGVCRTREPTRNFKLRILFNPTESPVLVPLAITGYKC